MITLTNYQKIKVTDTINDTQYWTKDITFTTQDNNDIMILDGKYGVEIRVACYVSLDDLKEAIAQFEMCIIFELETKKYTAFDLMIWSEPYASKIDVKLHKAITKQMEELGWL